MTHALKRKVLKVVPIGSAARASRSDLNLRLQAAARKADLLAWALQGVMAMEENDDVWPLQDAAHELKDDLVALSEEVLA